MGDLTEGLGRVWESYMPMVRAVSKGCRHYPRPWLIQGEPEIWNQKFREESLGVAAQVLNPSTEEAASPRIARASWKNPLLENQKQKEVGKEGNLETPQKSSSLQSPTNILHC